MDGLIFKVAQIYDNPGPDLVRSCPFLAVLDYVIFDEDFYSCSRGAINTIVLGQRTGSLYTVLRRKT